MDVPFDRFILSRNANTYPIQPAVQAYEIQVDNNLKKNLNERLYIAQTNELKKIIDTMLFGQIAYDNNFMENMRISVGLNGLREMYSDIYNDMQISNNEDTKKFVIKFGILRELLIHGSYTCYREELSQALQIYVDNYLHLNISELRDMLLQSSIQWRILIRNTFSVNKYMERKKEFYLEILDCIKKIIAIEENTYGLIGEKLKLL